MRLRVLLLGGIVLVVAVGCSAGATSVPATPPPSGQASDAAMSIEVNVTGHYGAGMKATITVTDQR